jgi:hypothetical protein
MRDTVGSRLPTFTAEQLKVTHFLLMYNRCHRVFLFCLTCIVSLCLSSMFARAACGRLAGLRGAELLLPLRNLPGHDDRCGYPLLLQGHEHHQVGYSFTHVNTTLERGFATLVEAATCLEVVPVVTNWPSCCVQRVRPVVAAVPDRLGHLRARPEGPAHLHQGHVSPSSRNTLCWLL